MVLYVNSIAVYDLLTNTFVKYSGTIAHHELLWT